MVNGTYRIKLKVGDEARRFTLQQPSIEELYDHYQRILGNNENEGISTYYIDQDNDEIKISTDDELAEAFVNGDVKDCLVLYAKVKDTKIQSEIHLPIPPPLPSTPAPSSSSIPTRPTSPTQPNVSIPPSPSVLFDIFNTPIPPPPPHPQYPPSLFDSYPQQFNQNTTHTNSNTPNGFSNSSMMTDFLSEFFGYDFSFILHFFNQTLSTTTTRQAYQNCQIYSKNGLQSLLNMPIKKFFKFVVLFYLFFWFFLGIICTVGNIIKSVFWFFLILRGIMVFFSWMKKRFIHRYVRRHCTARQYYRQ